jgi:hypothetical protein
MPSPPTSLDLSPHRFEPRPEFLGWVTQIASEITTALQGRDLAWLAAVGVEIESAMRPTRFSAQQLAAVSATPKVAPEIADRPFFDHYRLGEINAFASLEPAHCWDAEEHIERWERYAVFALRQIRTAYAYLGDVDGAPDLVGEGGKLVDAMNSAAGYTIEAMRALQIAHSLQFEARVLSEQNRRVAVERHAKNRSKRAEAIERADQGKHDGSAFTTLEAAAEYISGRLVKKAETQELYKYETVKKWLLASKWKPKHKRAP